MQVPCLMCLFSCLSFIPIHGRDLNAFEQKRICPQFYTFMPEHHRCIKILPDGLNEFLNAEGNCNMALGYDLDSIGLLTLEDEQLKQAMCKRATDFLATHPTIKISKFWIGVRGDVETLQYKHTRTGKILPFNESASFPDKECMALVTPNCVLEASSCNTNGGGICEVFAPDKCSYNNGGCKGGCFITKPRRRYCFCNDGYEQVNITDCKDINECTHKHYAKCAHQCQNLPGTFKCLCDEGFEQKGTLCPDLNECLVNNGGCDHNCTNSYGSHNCSCNEGFEMKDNICTRKPSSNNTLLMIILACVSIISLIAVLAVTMTIEVSRRKRKDKVKASKCKSVANAPPINEGVTASTAPTWPCTHGLEGSAV